MGFPDEIAGAASGVASAVTGGQFRPAYEATRDGMREAYRADEAAFPMTSLAGQVVGGAALPLGIVGNFARGAASLGGAALRSAGVGAGLGGVSGFGEGEGGAGQRAGSALIGGAAGGVVGAAVPPLFAAGGSLAFSAFLNSDRISESETIDYRPEACERDPYRCSGQVIFQKSGNDLGHLLIAEVFGAEVLEDFMRSDALKTINEPGGGSSQVSVFYAGNRFNYTTWVHSEPGRTRAISHFTVLGKNDAELRRRIRLAETCSNPAMRSDPLCSAP
jgi:hypothetical protein